jgi:NADPH:quinone reductase-like Zn-dependent oxidoreductase
MMVAMGFIGEKGQLGCEAAGIVRRIGSGPHHQQFREGDRVCVVQEGTLRTSITTKSSHCFQLSQEISLEDAATVPVVYSTVAHSLLTVGDLKKGQVSKFVAFIRDTAKGDSLS